ncbi:hypothetical protein BFP72_08710 [Reichenbachiella sp. 5M10]|uniref:O-methyltransferase n=1 Tax=Reichenbachiella sp. 5M10 TaxID=1889772 RepID=UPI000C145CB7|nr:class I SAM-dependent methyltransferase [Reichenbachiella sp. 5M10]PIB35467.1 hypothetical protein BFP72_08710 [Reichenbachiella sp. 5M10]
MEINVALFRIKRFFIYWLTKMDEHSLQPPFVFSLYCTVLKPASKMDDTHPALCLWVELTKDTNLVDSTAGAGTSLGASQTIGQIAKYGTTPMRYSWMIKRMLEHIEAKSVLELGTSLGLNVSVLAEAQTVQSVVTVERNVMLAQKAQTHFSLLGVDTKVRLLEQDIDDVLPNMLDCGESFDLIYLDANHTYEATMRYWGMLRGLVNPQLGVVIFDDINWSSGMRRAWEEISGAFGQGIVIENFQMGILVFKRELSKKSYVLDF